MTVTRLGALVFLGCNASCQLVLGFEEHEPYPTGGEPAGGSGSGGATLAVGEPCAGNAQCLNGNCVDAFCCEQACTGACQACSAELTGQDNGVCSFVSSTTDPHDDCPSAADSCEADMCTGTGPSCQVAALGTSCGAESCRNGTTFTPTCDEAGTCDPMADTCDGHACDGSVCGTNCGGDDALCVSTHFCTGGACVADRVQGQACERAAQCPNDHCIDGICCESACDGECQMCQATGLCGLVPNGTDDVPSCPGSQTCCNGNCVNNCP